MRASGKVNVIGLAIVGAFVAGLYWVTFFGPLYLDNLDVKELAQGAYGQRGRIKGELIRADLIAKLSGLRIGTHETYDNATGQWKVVEGLGIPDEDVVVEDDTVRKTLLVRVTYARKIVLWPTKKERKVPFLVEFRGAY